MAEAPYMKWLPEAALKTIGRLEFLAHSTVDGFISGKHRSARKGSSVEFAEHRQYVAGDDLRNLDWKLVARRQRFYIKQYVDEKIIVLDMKRRKAAQLIRDTAVDKEPEAKEEAAETKEEAAE